LLSYGEDLEAFEDNPCAPEVDVVDCTLRHYMVALDAALDEIRRLDEIIVSMTGGRE
jgi:hypothetical protein